MNNSKTDILLQAIKNHTDKSIMNGVVLCDFEKIYIENDFVYEAITEEMLLAEKLIKTIIF